MDSLSQFVLGAGVSMAFLAPKIGARKAAILGGVLGTLPDLDVLVPFADPIDSFTLHRGPSHSLFVHLLAAPILGEVVLRLFKGLEGARLRTYAGVLAVLWTHALLDWMTVYGTRIFWPFRPEPLGVGSIFIIDPLYTLPLLILTLTAFFIKGWGPGIRAGTGVALVLSTLYLGWSATAQSLIEQRARVWLEREGVDAERIIAIPTPFNTAFWRVIAVNDGTYANLYVPFFGDDRAIRLYRHNRIPEGLDCVQSLPRARVLMDFASGFWRIERRGDRIAIADLRMGLTPTYVFRFVVAEYRDGGIEPVAAEQLRERRTANGDWDWLMSGVAQRPVERVSEQEIALEPGALISQAARDRMTGSVC